MKDEIEKLEAALYVVTPVAEFRTSLGIRGFEPVDTLVDAARVTVEAYKQEQAGGLEVLWDYALYQTGEQVVEALRKRAPEWLVAIAEAVDRRCLGDPSTFCSCAVMAMHMSALHEPDCPCAPAPSHHTITINARSYTFVDDGSYTTQEIAMGLAASINVDRNQDVRAEVREGGVLFLMRRLAASEVAFSVSSDRVGAELEPGPYFSREAADLIYEGAAQRLREAVNEPSLPWLPDDTRRLINTRGAEGAVYGEARYGPSELDVARFVHPGTLHYAAADFRASPLFDESGPVAEDSGDRESDDDD